MKIGHHFQAKKTSATPKLCKRNFSQMHHVGGMIFLSLVAPIFEVEKNRQHVWGSYRQKIHIYKTVHLRKISPTEFRGSRSFFCLKVVPIFYFEHFLEQFLQTIAAPSG